MAVRAQYNHHLKIAKRYLNKDTDKALVSIKEACHLAHELGDKERATALYERGNIFMFNGEYPKAIPDLQQSVDIFERLGMPEQSVKGNNSIGIICLRQGIPDKALEYFLSGLKTGQALNDPKLLSGSYANLGNVHMDAKRFENAKLCYEKSLEYATGLNDQGLMSIIINNLGYVYGETGNMEQALESFQDSLTMKRELEDHIGAANTLNNIGLCYQDLKQPEKAIQSFRESIRLLLNAGSHDTLAISLGCLAKLYCDLGDCKRANAYAKKTLQYGESEKRAKAAKMGLEVLIKVHSKKQNWELTSGYQQKLMELNAKLYDDSGAAEQLRAQVSLELELNRKERVEKLTRELKERISAKDAQLQEIHGELELFPSMISKDLQAPLKGTGMFTQLLKKKYSNTLDSRGNDYLNQIERGVLEMRDLISDLSVFSGINRQSFYLEVVDMQELVQQCFKEVTDDQPHNAQFQAKDLPEVPADKALLKLAITNLLSNAIKYSGKEELPAVSVSGKKNRSEIIYSVRDNGVGFPQEKSTVIFKPFSYQHSREHFSGSGIGLAIVKKVVDRHGGRVWAESIPREGATFFFALPTKP